MKNTPVKAEKDIYKDPLDYQKRCDAMNAELHKAVMSNDQTVAIRLIKSGARVDPKFRYGISLLPGTLLYLPLTQGSYS